MQRCVNSCTVFLRTLHVVRLIAGVHRGLVGIMFLACLVTLILSGCSNRKVPVYGVVTFDGEPVKVGTIVLEPADGQGPTTGGKIADGKYSLMGKAAPIPGRKKVRVSAARKTGRRIPAGPPAPPGQMIEEIIRYIPKSYNERSTLFCDVLADGSHEINFDLKSQKN